jgi:hypothetical protein
MSAEENKALVRRFYVEVWDRGNTDLALDVFAEDYVRHDFRRPTRCRGQRVRRRSQMTFAPPSLTLRSRSI